MSNSVRDLKLSIIVPVYNAESFIEESVKNLLNQTYQNKEIILVDDGSKDASGKLLDSLAEQHSELRVIHQENQGAPAARNTGLRNASGDLIAFVDIDDGVDLFCYEILVDELLRTNSEVSVCGYRTEYSGNLHINSVKPKQWNTVEVSGRVKCLEQLSTKENGLAGFVWNKVYRKEIIGDLLFDEKVAIIDDLVFTYNCINKTQKVCYVGIPMYHYRYVASSISKKPNMKRFMNCLESHKRLCDWLEITAPSCLPSAAADYIFWNTKTAETMLNRVDTEAYEIIKENINEYKKYLPYCGKRVKLLANCLLKSWNLYRVIGGGEYGN